MVIKESEDSSTDDGFIKRYIRDDLDENPEQFLREKFETKKSSATEVFSRVGEGESYRENNDFNRRWNKANEDDVGIKTSNEKVEFTSKPITEAKKEFLEHLEDESLSIDTCSQINKDWKRK